MPALASGTVAFLFSDIEGSTTLRQSLGSGSRAVLERHARLVRAAIDTAGVTIVSTEGASCSGVIDGAPRAIGAAVAIRRAPASEPWPDGGRARPPHPAHR